MPDPVTAVTAGAGLFSSYMNNRAQSNAAAEAAGAQVRSAELGIEEQRRQFDRVQELLNPYVTAGTQAIGAQGALVGLEGDQAQQEAIAAIEDSPIFTSLVRQGEEAILQNASATGGLRGGNVQGALAQFRPALLNQMLTQQYNRLGGISGLGQASAAGVGAAAQTTGTNVANLLTQQGQAYAGQALAEGKGKAQLYGDIAQTVTTVAGAF